MRHFKIGQLPESWTVESLLKKHPSRAFNPGKRSPDDRFLESFTGRQAIIDLHVKGIIAFIDEYYKKDWRFID